MLTQTASRTSNVESSVTELLREATAALRARGISTPRLDAEVLLAHTLGVSRAGLYARLYDPCPSRQAEAFRRLIQRRARREPLQYITGIQEFWSLEVMVDSRVLIPRPETEVVVETALGLLASSVAGSKSKVQSSKFKVFNPQSAIRNPQSVAPQSAIKVLDVGTGSGCIAIALAAELPQAEVWAVDVSHDALTVAEANAQRHGVAGRITFLQGDLFTPVAGQENEFDLIVTNPPYIPRYDLATLQPEVQHWEPHTALDGGG
ncbi:MAG: peptide chain release factor N(5)-glutamine methyltransferase, partial [Candidatus Binatia bacterium]